MKNKTVFVADVGVIQVRRRKRMKNIRLRLQPDGSVVLAFPWWVSLKKALSFVDDKKNWLTNERKKITLEIKHGMSFSADKQLSLIRTNSSRIHSTLRDNELIIKIPAKMSAIEAETKIKKVMQKIIKSDAEAMLLPRLRALAENHGYEYKTASVSILRSRWGSCDQNKHIKINAYLVQLPNQLIDYVLCHELNHTKHMNHSPDFWKELRQVFPGIETAKQEIKKYSPRIYAN